MIATRLMAKSYFEDKFVKKNIAPKESCRINIFALSMEKNYSAFQLNEIDNLLHYHIIFFYLKVD